MEKAITTGIHLLCCLVAGFLGGQLVYSGKGDGIPFFWLLAGAFPYGVAYLLKESRLPILLLPSVTMGVTLGSLGRGDGVGWHEAAQEIVGVPCLAFVIAWLALLPKRLSRKLESDEVDK